MGEVLKISVGILKNKLDLGEISCINADNVLLSTGQTPHSGCIITRQLVSCFGIRVINKYFTPSFVNLHCAVPHFGHFGFLPETTRKWSSKQYLNFQFISAEKKELRNSHCSLLNITITEEEVYCYSFADK